MTMIRLSAALILSGLVFGVGINELKADPLVIAHRGASGYLPEHSLAAAAAAHSMDSDYIEQDVVLTKDDQAIVLHDIHLDAVTDVAKKYPDRARDDGRFYAIDFTLEEIKTLKLGERINVRTGQPVYHQRFPTIPKLLTIPTLEEEVLLIAGMNASRNKQVGIYPEIKQPAWHRKQGKDISRVVLQVLKRLGYQKLEDPIFLQCFDARELERIRHELKCQLPLVQLIGKDKVGSDDYAKMTTPKGLQKIATYAQGIGPDLRLVISDFRDGQPQVTSLTQDAQRAGLVVHPYTFRADQMPSQVTDFATLVRTFAVDAGVDGMFTDHPDLTRQALESVPADR